MKLVICVGPCCSGKTTWCKKYLENNPDAVKFGLDDFKLMLKNNLNGDIVDEEFVTIVDDLIIKLFLAYKHVVVDGYFLNLQRLRMFTGLTKDHEIVVFDVSLPESSVRNQLRKKRTGIYVDMRELERFHRKYENFVASEEFKNFAKTVKIRMNENEYNTEL